MVGYSVALLCLSINAYHEAGNQSLTGKEAQVDVVVQRSIDNGTDVCTEVLRPHQFTWISGKRNIAYLEADKRRLLHKIKGNQAEMKAWNESVTTAALVLSQSHLRFHFDQYHTTKVHPKWARHRHEVKIGNHLFSRSKSKCAPKHKVHYSHSAFSPAALCIKPKQTTGATTATTRLMKLSSLLKSIQTPALQLTRMVTLPFQPTWAMVRQLPLFTVNTHSQTIFGITKRKT